MVDGCGSVGRGCLRQEGWGSVWAWEVTGWGARGREGGGADPGFRRPGPELSGSTNTPVLSTREAAQAQLYTGRGVTGGGPWPHPSLGLPPQAWLSLHRQWLPGGTSQRPPARSQSHVGPPRGLSGVRHVGLEPCALSVSGLRVAALSPTPAAPQPGQAGPGPGAAGSTVSSCSRHRRVRQGSPPKPC